MNKFIIKYKYILLISFIVMFMMISLFIYPRYYGHDTAFHISNIYSLANSISLDNIFGNNLVLVGRNSFGYGTYFFYPKLPHLLSAYFYLITNDIYISMNIIYFVTSLVSSLLVYILSKKVFNNDFVAVVSSIMYLTFPYHLCDIYIRDAFNECFMFMVFPMIFLGLYNLRHKVDQYFYIPFILGCLIGIYSHLVSMFFYFILISIYLGINFNIYFRRDKLKALILSFIIVFLLSLPFLITILEYKNLDMYTVFVGDSFTSKKKVVDSVLSLKAFVLNDNDNNMLMFYFNYATIILFLITTCQIVFMKKECKVKKKLLLYILLMVLLLCSKWIWNSLPDIFLMIQFVWRLLIPFGLLVCLYSPLCLLDISYKEIRFFLCFILLLIIINDGFFNIRYYSDVEYDVVGIIEDDMSMGWQREYLPVVCNEGYYSTYYDKRSDEIISDDLDISILDDNYLNMKFSVDGVLGESEIEFPRVYYLGYVLVDSDGKKYDLYSNDKGFLTANINKDGIYYLKHKKTLLESISICISLLTLIILFCLKVGKFKIWKIKK